MGTRDKGEDHIGQQREKQRREDLVQAASKGEIVPQKKGGDSQQERSDHRRPIASGRHCHVKCSNLDLVISV